jgi:hypothetical protein
MRILHVGLVRLGVLALSVLVVAADRCEDMTTGKDTDCDFAAGNMFKGSKVCYLQDDCVTKATILIPDGYTVDGQGYTVTAAEASGGGWTGAILKNGGETARVKNIEVTTRDLACACKSGDERLRGVLFDGASGSITSVRAIDINKGGCGCQEGNGIEARNNCPSSACTGSCSHEQKLKVEISNNVVEKPQKTGIVVSCAIDGNVHDNAIIGLGKVSYIAQNGIQFSYGAEGLIVRNTVSGSWYTGDFWGATGIMMFETMDGIMVSQNTLIDNQVRPQNADSCHLSAEMNANNFIVSRSLYRVELQHKVGAGSAFLVQITTRLFIMIFPIPMKESPSLPTICLVTHVRMHQV